MKGMARPTNSRRLHVAAFDLLLGIKGLTCAELARTNVVSESQLSDMRSGRRSVSPVMAAALAKELDLPTAEPILWPIRAVEVSAA
jgi:antitoxin component HigA of HigAB toxin-antitoxin module